MEALPDISRDSVASMYVPLACAFNRMHQKRGVCHHVWWQGKVIWGLEMRGPQIMRNISQLLWPRRSTARPKSAGKRHRANRESAQPLQVHRKKWQMSRSPIF